MNGKSMPSEATLFPGSEFVYIPTLRGMRLNHQTAYFDRTWIDYFADRTTQETILKSNDGGASFLGHARNERNGTSIRTGLDLYDTLQDKLLGSFEDRRFVRMYEEYLQKRFFQVIG